MGTWKTRGLRGSTLEDLINHTNESYREKKLALIQKIPTPITPIEIDKSSRHITLAYFDQKSTVDYIGAVQGIPVCFDAKECAVKTFIIVHYTALDEMYYVPFTDVKKFWDRMEAGGRKSFTYDEIDKNWKIRSHRDMYVHYLEPLSIDLSQRENDQ